MSFWGLRFDERSTRFVPRSDRGISPDVRQVLDAAAALGVTEFELFRLAYRRWLGEEPRTDRVERVYAPYMFHQTVPHYVGQFARTVLAQARGRCLDPASFGVPQRPTAAPHRHGVPIVLGTLLLTAGFVAMLIFARNDPIHGRRHMLCQDGPTAAFAQKVARGMTGKPDPFRCRRR